MRGLHVRFGAKEVVRDVCFDISPGEKFALVGESGSGKTITALSLLRLASDAVLQGSAVFKGRDLLALSEREMRGVRGGDIAMIFQEPMTALNPLMTVGRQISEVLELKQALSQAQSELERIACHTRDAYDQRDAARAALEVERARVARIEDVRETALADPA